MSRALKNESTLRRLRAEVVLACAAIGNARSAADEDPAVVEAKAARDAAERRYRTTLRETQVRFAGPDAVARYAQATARHIDAKDRVRRGLDAEPDVVELVVARELASLDPAEFVAPYEIAFDSPPCEHFARRK